MFSSILLPLRWFSRYDKEVIFQSLHLVCKLSIIHAHLGFACDFLVDLYNQRFLALVCYEHTAQLFSMLVDVDIHLDEDAEPLKYYC